MATEILHDEYTLELMERLAKRLEAESGVLANYLAVNDITAADLGIDRAQFAHLQLCFMPRPDSLEQDIQTIAKTANVSVDLVRKVLAR